MDRENDSSCSYHLSDIKSYVAVVTIPKANAEDVIKNLGRLYHNEGWNSKFVGFPSAGPARAVGAVCGRALDRCLSQPALRVPPKLSQCNVSVLIPDRSVVSAPHVSSSVSLHPARPMSSTSGFVVVHILLRDCRVSYVSYFIGSN